MALNCEECLKSGFRTEEDKTYILKRLNVIEGQIKGIKGMVEEDRYCNDILTQLSAVERSLKTLGNNILKNHMKTCVADNIKNGDMSSVDDVIDLLDKINK